MLGNYYTYSLELSSITGEHLDISDTQPNLIVGNIYRLMNSRGVARRGGLYFIDLDLDLLILSSRFDIPIEIIKSDPKLNRTSYYHRVSALDLNQMFILCITDCSGSRTHPIYKFDLYLDSFSRYE